MLSLILAALIINNSGSAVSNLMVRDDYAHRQIAEDGIGRTTWLPEIVVTAPRLTMLRVNTLGSTMADYNPEGTVWLPEIVVTAPRPSKSKTGKSQFSWVDQGPDGTIWLSEVVVTAKRITPSVVLRSSHTDVLPFLVAGALVAFSMALGIALLPSHEIPVRPARLIPVRVRSSKKV
jgi:hypothetical protein